MTLIELYDERPIENVLATEMFCPERTVYLCPSVVFQNKTAQKKLKEYFEHRGIKTELVFLESSMYNTEKLEKQLKNVVDTFGECVLDITGGTDAALFACGRLCAENDVPVFTYSRKRNRFYNINRADFADGLLCTVSHNVCDCFMMAGGSLREGRTDNSLLRNYLGSIEPFFDFYLRHKTEWGRLIKYIQITSQTAKGEAIPLFVEAPYSVRNERGGKTDAPVQCLFELEKLGFLKNVSAEKRVKYTFADHQIRTWLRDRGSVLELYVYKLCLDTGIFNDVVTSAVVDWEGGEKGVTNEIDVMAMRGVFPLFISCKTCEIDTNALNELDVLRDRFGGHGAAAAIITTKYCAGITRRRAFDLNISVFDLNDLKRKDLKEQITALVKKT